MPLWKALPAAEARTRASSEARRRLISPLIPWQSSQRNLIMERIRILVVDDSVVIRKLLCDTLGKDPEIEVVGTASDGRLGLAKIAQLHPDVVTLDIEMPVMNGLEALAQIRKLYPRMPVIMFSTLTGRGAAATLDALSLGASDYATKPGGTGNIASAAESVLSDLLPKIKALCGRSPVKSFLIPSPAPRRAVAASQKIEIVAIGTSTGGPNALAEVIPHLPKDFPVPVVIVQHMPPVFTQLLAQRLGSRAQLPVREGAAGENLVPGRVWIAPGDYHMIVVRRGTVVTLGLTQGPQENSCRPAVDVLFRSVAKTYGASVLAVVMTGMGSDGALGARQIHEGGGQVLVQDESSSVVWGMPGAVVDAGLADKICPLRDIAQEIIRRVTVARNELAGVGAIAGM